MSNSRPRVSNIDVLRGLAALSVCFFHFSRADYLSPSKMQNVAQFGYLGVDAFFVISGFVIPLALWRSGYQLRALPRFLFARFFRLYPAFLATLLLIVALGWASSLTPGFKGLAPHFPVEQLLCNLTLTCDAIGQPWLIPIFWTLAVEAQYYLVIALTFPLLASADQRVRFICALAWVGGGLLIRAPLSLFPYCALFGMGIAAFLKSAELIDMRRAGLLVGLAFAAQWYRADFPSAVTGLVSCGFILWTPEIRTRPLLFLGSVSYSLYLVHVPIGGRVINLFERFPHTLLMRSLAVSVALALSLFASYLLWASVEQPSHKLSRRFTFARRK